MCYRYTLTDLIAVRAMFEAAGLGVDLDLPAHQPRYNVALTNLMPVVIFQGGPKVSALRFGLTLPARLPEQKPLLLANARAETLLAKPAFRDATLCRRCLVPADGFYEWEKAGTARLPHYFTLKSRQPFFFAGLWEPENAVVPASFAIVTTTPNPLLQPIHDRMPVILGPNSGPAWLGEEPLNPARMTQLCRPFASDQMTACRVDPRVNNVRYEAADCIAPI